MRDHHVAHLADDDGIVLREDLSRAGLLDADVRRLMRRGELLRVQRGRYLVPSTEPAAADLFRARVRAAVRADPRLTPTGQAAIVLHRLPLLGPIPDAISAARPYTRGRSRTSGVRVTGLLPPEDIVLLDGVPVSGVARAVLDTARWAGVPAGVVAADAALARRILSADQVAAAVGRMSGRWRVADARRVPELMCASSESPGESWSAVLLDDAGIEPPQRQVDVADAGDLIGRVDFAWLEHRVVGEFDGRVKYGRLNPALRPPEDVLWEEKLREDRLRSAGLTVVRWTWDDLRNPVPWLTRLRAALSRGRRRGSASCPASNAEFSVQGRVQRSPGRR